MRETRYAVMALAEAFPRASSPHTGWGNRDDGPARLPRTDSSSTRSTIWRTSGRSPSLTGFGLRVRSSPCSNIPSRSCGHGRGRLSGPAGPGRIGGTARGPARAIRPRSSGAARPGHCDGWVTRVIGVDPIKEALENPDPRIRRGAGRIFAYQFHGMDTRLDLADRLIELCRRPGSLDPPPGPQDLAPVVLSHERPRRSSGGSSILTWRGWPSRRPRSCVRT